jgi:hypothetical protein
VQHRYHHQRQHDHHRPQQHTAAQSSTRTSSSSSSFAAAALLALALALAPPPPPPPALPALMPALLLVRACTRRSDDGGGGGGGGGSRGSWCGAGVVVVRLDTHRHRSREASHVHSGQQEHKRANSSGRSTIERTAAPKPKQQPCALCSVGTHPCARFAAALHIGPGTISVPTQDHQQRDNTTTSAVM